MPVQVNDEGLTVIDFEHDISISHCKAEKNNGVLVAFDSCWVEENRKFEPKALMYFNKVKDIDMLIDTLQKAKKVLTPKKHHPETDNVPSESLKK